MNKSIEELKHWTWTTQKRIGNYSLKLNEVMNIEPILGIPDVKSQRLNSEAEAELHALINAAHQMFKTAELAAVDYKIIDQSLKDLVRNLRNLREHWDSNQQYFENPDLTIPKNSNTRSARWFKEHFPDSTPWSGGWTNLCGYTAGPLYLGQLYEQANRLLFVIMKNKRHDTTKV